MARKVVLDDILDLQRYEEQRDDYRRRIFEVKRQRRVHLGPYLTFLFENADTVRYQVQEMVRSERMVRDDQIEFEIQTYNELIGDAGQVGCSLLIEIDDRALRAKLLVAWRDLPEHLYLALDDGTRIRARIDERQRDEERLSAVQFLIFDTGDRPPVAVGCDHPEYTHEQAFSDEERAAVESDLRA